METFNPDSFMSTVTTEANDTSYIPIPEGEWAAYIKDIKPRQAKSSAILDVFWIITDPKVAEATGRPDPQIRQSVFLDITAEGALDLGKGKNIALGQLRDAVNQNQKGQPWSPGNLIGQPAVIRVVHDQNRIYNGQPSVDVKGVARA